MTCGGSKRHSLRARKMRSIWKRAGFPSTWPKRAHFSKHLKRNKKNKKRVSRKRSSKRMRFGNWRYYFYKKYKKVQDYKKQQND